MLCLYTYGEMVSYFPSKEAAWVRFPLGVLFFII